MAATPRFLVLAVLILPGCCLEPHSDPVPYHPRSPKEQALLPQAHRDLFPDDVRKDPAAHQGDLVMWAGVIRRVDLAEGACLVRVLVEHHYWDYLERPEEYGIFLSPRGEGSFIAEMACQSPQDAAGLRDRGVRVGDMAIVFGKPARVEGEVPVLASNAFRGLKPSRFNLRAKDYGRDEVVKAVKGK